MHIISALEARKLLATKPKRSKYNNKRVKADGHTFDSQAEHKRYVVLKMLQRAGKISELEVHPKFDLHAWRAIPVKIGFYEADFQYRKPPAKPWADSILVVEDVKGVETDLFKWKRKHVEIEYSITVTLI